MNLLKNDRKMRVWKSVNNIICDESLLHIRYERQCITNHAPWNKSRFFTSKYVGLYKVRKKTYEIVDDTRKLAGIWHVNDLELKLQLFICERDICDRILASPIIIFLPYIHSNFQLCGLPVIQVPTSYFLCVSCWTWVEDNSSISSFILINIVETYA